MNFTIGSLFDGSGGFPLAATMCGGTPKWASEIEPYPIAVTKSRFPNVKHLGSVTDIKGGEIDPVDVITFGSPCQDLSVAGKRAGLKHEANGDDETTRSGLFMEAVRIIKEMREATNGVYPRFALWENVPGAFSSNKGEDFRIVLQELIQIVEPSAVMPTVPKSGWNYADFFRGDGWSIAYRVLDAQYWGVPQRRRRIYLVLDLGGECAGEVLFERDGLRGYFETGRTPWQTTAGDAEGGVGTADCEGNRVNVLNPWDSQGNQVHDGTGNNIYPCLRGCGGAGYQAGYVLAVDQGGGKSGANFHHDLSLTLTCTHGGEPAVVYALDQQGGKGGANYAEDVMPTLCSDSHGTPHAVAYPNMILDDQGGSQISVREDGKSPTLRAEMHGNVPVVLGVLASSAKNAEITDGKITPCLMARAGTGGNQLPLVAYKAVAFQTYQKVTDPLMANSHPGSYTGQDAFNDMLVAGAFCPETGGNDPSRSVAFQEELCPTLRAGCTQAAVIGKEETPAAASVRYIVRRLTPTECARLQGFPDTWGHPIEKTDLTDEEYQFWLNVRNTHAAINDKATKDYTKDQMLKWYNSLRTDSSEYKMWGNGIALPCALYVMQGIADVCGTKVSEKRNVGEKMKIMLDKYKNAILPTRAHPFDGGLDLYAPEASEVPGAVGLGGLVADRFEVVCGKAIINTGVHVAIPDGCVGLVKSRSGLMTKHGITTDGTIDSGYTGPIKVCLLNHSSKRYYIERGERIAQLVILPCLLPELELVDSLEETDRGDNGFGSTGR